MLSWAHLSLVVHTYAKEKEKPMALVSIQKAARELGVSTDTVSRRIKAGEWPYYPLGKRAIRLDVDEIKALGKIPPQMTQTVQL